MKRFASGRTATLYRLDDGRALKLYDADIGREHVERELSAMRLARRVELFVPTPGELVERDGGWGLTMEWLAGENGMERIYAGADPETEARALARLQSTLHQASGVGLRTAHERLGAILPRVEALTDGERARVLAVLETLPDGESLLHGDFHPGNVLHTPEGPAILDWPDACCGAPVFDVARSLVLFSWEIADEPPHTTYARAYLHEHRALATPGLDRLDDALLICRAARLDEAAELAPDALLNLIRDKLLEFSVYPTPVADR